MADTTTQRGKLIVFEGIDGSGKSTQIALLERGLQSIGRRVYLTSEPTATATGGMIRDVLSGSVKRSPAELAALFLTDRIGHNVNPLNGIKKYLDDGMDVICDRYYYSSFAYQGLECNLKWVMDMNLNCPEILTPDLCIFLDVDEKNCKARVDKARPYLEIFEQSSEQLGHIRNKFFEVFAKLGGTQNIKIVDAARDTGAVARDILALAKVIYE